VLRKRRRCGCYLARSLTTDAKIRPGKADTSALDADTIVSADINGDAVADFQIQLKRAFKLNPTDSIL
jgi:hypothetical protein